MSFKEYINEGKNYVKNIEKAWIPFVATLDDVHSMISDNALGNPENKKIQKAAEDISKAYDDVDSAVQRFKKIVKGY